MPDRPIIDPTLIAELESIYLLFAALMRNSADGLGGKLLYAGELDREGAHLVRAANIAGAASLSATSDPAAQRAAIREGVIDFLVTSLDEALRILKNEIRKKNAVAVGIAAPPSQIVAEMHQRGVQPDLLRNEPHGTSADFLSQGAHRIEPIPPAPDHQMLIVPAPSHAFEERVLALLGEHDQTARRWLHLAPRYLGPQSRRIRSIYLPNSAAEKLKAEG